MLARRLQPYNDILSRDLELRLLPIGVQSDLHQLLDCNNSWTEIMARVRKESTSNAASPHKYTDHDIRTIQKAGVQQHRSCTEIFLSEWGTSGRRRPNLSTLLELLIDAQLFRAADYVADLLGENPPPRPADTPAAPVDVSAVIAQRANENNLSSIPNIIVEPAEESHPEDIPLPELILSPETGVLLYPYKQLEIYTNKFNADEEVGTPSGRVKRLLGAGGFGTVFLANLPNNQYVAVKRLETEGEIPILPEQFEYEVRTISKICHPNLLSLVGYSNDGPARCLLYEYLDGGNLQDRLANKEDPLQWLDRIKIAEYVAKGLDHLQNADGGPYVHRDVKTANILLSSTGDVKLGDFGLIRWAPPVDASRAMSTTNIVGSTAYMPEEALRGDISVKLDTYSYGVVLLELMTALPPYDRNREDVDLVMCIGSNCDKSFGSFLDASAGDWPSVVADTMFLISQDCVKEKRLRPVMSEVKRRISEIVQQQIS